MIGFQPREAERTLRSGSFRDRQLAVIPPILVPHLSCFGDHRLFHGATPPRLGPLRLLRAHALRLRCVRGKPDDGGGKRRSQFPHGHHHWGWHSGTNLGQASPSSTFSSTNSRVWLITLCCVQQGIFMLVAGFFRLPNDLPKVVWKYPMSYIGFHMYALQVSATSNCTTFTEKSLVLAFPVRENVHPGYMIPPIMYPMSWFQD
jgi:hypothetical protein